MEIKGIQFREPFLSEAQPAFSGSSTDFKIDSASSQPVGPNQTFNELACNLSAHTKISVNTGRSFSLQRVIFSIAAIVLASVGRRDDFSSEEKFM